jgi:hypothetical protein
MRTKLTAVAALAAVAAALVAVAAAKPSTTKQQIAFEVHRCGDTCAFVLTPLTAGAVKADSGTVTWCCWTQHFVSRDGQKVEIDSPVVGTFTGKQGTIKVSQQIEWVNIPDGYSISTGTWKVVGGTGAYAGLSGGGRHAGVGLPGGITKFREDGLVSLK